MSRQRASAHAKHHFDCSCGKRVWGNGGKAGHTWWCLTFYEHLVANLETLNRAYKHCNPRRLVEARERLAFLRERATA